MESGRRTEGRSQPSEVAIPFCSATSHDKIRVALHPHQHLELLMFQILATQIRTQKYFFFKDIFFEDTLKSHIFKSNLWDQWVSGIQKPQIWSSVVHSTLNTAWEAP